MNNNKFIQASLNKCKKMGSKVMQHSESAAKECESCCQWTLWPSYESITQETERYIPKDVPKGHTAVYVGQDHRRFVVKITLFKHPLFRALLDQARDQFDDSSTPTKLWIPCDETVFLHVLRCAQQG